MENFCFNMKSVGKRGDLYGGEAKGIRYKRVMHAVGLCEWELVLKTCLVEPSNLIFIFYKKMT